MGTILSRAIMVGLALAATVGAAACTAHPAGNGSAPPSSQATVSPSTSATMTQAASAATVAPSVTPTPSATPGGIQDLVVTSAVRSGLIAAYAFVRGMSTSWVAGTTPGSVYYAYDPATDTYWAMAHFDPSAIVPQSPDIAAGFQGPGAFGFFKKVGSGAWRGIQGGYETLCNESQWFPLPVLAVWGLPTSPP